MHPQDGGLWSLAALLAILGRLRPAAPSSEAGASSPLPVMSVPEVRPSAEPTGFAGTFYVAAMEDLGVLECAILCYATL